MAVVPSSKTRDVFSTSFDGVYGRFTTAQSFELDYLLTSIKANDLSLLETAASALPLKMIDFDEMIQRDIDYVRVDRQLVAEYLEAGSDRVVFFPPLLVSIVAFDENRERVKRYRSATSRKVNNQLVRTWDEDKFQLVLPLADQPTGYSIKDQNETYNYYHYAATLKTNPQSVKLVVIDGQHRFAALQRIMRNGEKQDLVKNIDLPLCTVFTPGAVEGPGNSEEILRDLRELFVTINNEAKRVSGHFFVLLKDRALSSLAIRCLANDWKNRADGALFSRLLLLEWNTREDRQAYQRQKPYSITTVSILATCFQNYIFDTAAQTQTLLNLSEVRDELRKAVSSPDYTSISEDVFGIEQIEVLKKQITKYLVPALTSLFLEPRPFKALSGALAKALEQLNKRVQANELGAAQFREDVLYQFRKCSDHDQLAVKDAETVFEGDIDQSESDSVYFLNVFQQGLVRAWSLICTKAVPTLELPPAVIAKALVAAWDVSVFDTKKRLLRNDRSYLQGLLFDGARVRINETARVQWANLIAASLIYEPAMTAFIATLSAQEPGPSKELAQRFKDELRELSKEKLGDYLEEFSNTSRKEMKRNWRFKGLDETTVAFLATREHSEKEEQRREFDDKVEALTNDAVGVARKALANMFGLRVSELP